MTETIKLDTRKGCSPVGVLSPLRRGERNNVTLTVSVLRNRRPCDLTGMTAHLVWQDADGKLVGPVPMEVTDTAAGTVSCTLPDACYSAVGAARAYIELRRGAELVDTTDEMLIKVLDCIDADAEQAEEYKPLIGEVREAVASAKRAAESAEAAKDAANKAATNANEAAKNANDSATKAEDATIHINESLDDIRTDYDGTIYATAGDAVRSQIGDLSETINGNKTNCKKGANIVINSNITLDECKALIGGGIAYGMDSLAILVALGLDSAHGSTFNHILESDKNLMADVIDYARGEGLFVNLRCAFYMQDNSPVDQANPSNPSLFFENWYDALNDVVSTAWAHGVRYVSVANECHTCIKNNRNGWAGIVHDLKVAYPGIHIGANVNSYYLEMTNIDVFYDYVGFDFYPELTKDQNASDGEIKAAMFCDRRNVDLVDWVFGYANEHPNTEIWISEIGTQSERNGLEKTWQNHYSPSVPDQAPQARYYRAWLETLYKGTTVIDGIYIWALFNGGGSSGDGYDFIGKQAGNVLMEYWA